MSRQKCKNCSIGQKHLTKESFCANCSLLKYGKWSDEFEAGTEKIEGEKKK